MVTHLTHDIINSPIPIHAVLFSLNSQCYIGLSSVRMCHVSDKAEKNEKWIGVLLFLDKANIILISLDGFRIPLKQVFLHGWKYKFALVNVALCRSRDRKETWKEQVKAANEKRRADFTVSNYTGIRQLITSYPFNRIPPTLSNTSLI